MKFSEYFLYFIIIIFTKFHYVTVTRSAIFSVMMFDGDMSKILFEFVPPYRYQNLVKIS